MYGDDICFGSNFSILRFKAQNKLELPAESRIHPVFHVSSLKLKLGQHVTPLPTLPPIDESGQVFTEPVAVLQKRTKSLRSRVITEVLV